MQRLTPTFLTLLALGLSGCGNVDGSQGMITDVRVVINEVVPQNQSHLDEDGNSFDWVELYNPSERSADLLGFFVSDDRSKPLRYQIPNSVVIEAEGYLVLWVDSESSGPLHVPFGLGADGESFVLSSPEGKVIDAVDYGAADADAAYARFPNGRGEFGWCVIPTPNSTNGSECGDPGS